MSFLTPEPAEARLTTAPERHRGETARKELGLSLRELRTPEAGSLGSASLSTHTFNGMSNRPVRDAGPWEKKYPEDLLAEVWRRLDGKALSFRHARNWVP